MSFSRSIFLTGFPGFIAGRLVEHLACTGTQFFLLVQPQFVDAAMESVGRISRSKNVPLENFALVEGDITKPDLGIAEADLDSIKTETTDIFHLAAVYDLAVAKNIAYTVNLDGTKNVNQFAGSLENLHRYNYVSTCYVAGKRKGRILETELAHSAGFRNHYEETKYLAEMEVERLKKELPVTIFRPSVVVGDSTSGETAKYDGIYYLIHYLRRAPKLLRLVNVGNTRVRLNLVPVDFVVESMAALAFDENTEGETLALADPAPLTTAELFDEIASKLSGKPSVITPPAQLVEVSLSTPISPPITGLPLFGVPYFFLEQEYDTRESGNQLLQHGIRCPKFATYVGNLIDFVETHPKLN
jgi:nucleoside-diphosphate-sugar epimerase